jgi:hypothetical protein
MSNELIEKIVDKISIPIKKYKKPISNIKELKEKTIGESRSVREPEEEFTSSYLVKNNITNFKTNLESIKEDILRMNTRGTNYTSLPNKEKELVKKLKEDEEIVDITLASVFRWFGSHVGNRQIKQLMEDYDSFMEEKYGGHKL